MAQIDEDAASAGAPSANSDTVPDDTAVPEAAPEDAFDPMQETATGSDVQLDQDSIDSLFGEPVGGVAAPPLTGLSLLIGASIVAHERLPMVDIIIDRFSRIFASGVRKYTMDNCDVSVGKSQPIRVGDFLNRVSLPAMIAIVWADQWEGHILIALSASLVGSLVDVLLGGRRNHAEAIEGRSYTPIERVLIERFVNEVLLGDLKSAFSTVCDIDFHAERYESTPAYAAITELSAAALSFRTEIAMDGGRGGWIDFLIPYSVLEPARAVLSQEFLGKKHGADEVWNRHLSSEVSQASVDLEIVMERRASTVAEVVQWKPGSILLLDRRGSDLVELVCDTDVVAHAHICEMDGKIALRVDDVTASMQEI